MTSTRVTLAFVKVNVSARDQLAARREDQSDRSIDERRLYELAALARAR